MNLRIHRLLPLFLFIGFAVVTVTAFAEFTPQTAYTFDGKPVTLGGASDKPLLVFFLATRCPVSNAYNERMEAFVKEYADKVKVVGVNPNETEDNAEVAAHAKENGLTFPIYRDTTYELIGAWKVRVTPEAFLFDKAGKLYYHGRIDDEQDSAKVKSQDLRNEVDRLLAGKPALLGSTRPFGCSVKRLSTK